MWNVRTEKNVQIQVSAEIIVWGYVFIRLAITALYLTYRLSTRRGIMIFYFHQFYSLWHDRIEYSWFESFTRITYTKLYIVVWMKYA